MDSNAPCKNYGHPKHKHGDQVETFGCYAWESHKPLKICVCEEFTSE